MDAVIRYLRSNRWARTGLSGLSVVLLLSAVGLLGYPFYTNLYQGRVQSRLDREIASPEHKELYRKAQLKEGDALTRLKIPKLDVDVVVVEGTGASALRAGAGHYPDTPLPCEDGNVAIAGHRTTYGKPFANVDRLKVGDTIILETPIGSCTYEVNKVPFIVNPTNRSVVANTPGEHILTLTTCHPKGSAKERLIISATLTQGASTRT
ncbi:MAG TPA: class E sortase [Acidimicrobiales bacterium]|nr:class E sortase [Acidimicrobiales bacterium]